MKKYIIKQQDEYDCGACSLQSIILYYKGYVPLEVIKSDTYTNTNGTNFLYLKQASEKYGFDVVGKYTLDLNNIILPCIAQININGYNHFITIYKVNNNITYMDPSSGVVTLKKADFFNIYTGNILELIPTGKIVKYKKNKDFINIIKSIYFNNIKKIILLFILLIILTILSLVGNFNLILIKNNKLIYLVFLILISKVMINYLKNLIMSHLNKNINNDLLKNYIKYIFNLPLKYLQLKKSGDLINRMNDLNNVKDFFSSNVVDLFLNMIFFISSLGLLFILDSKITLILLVLVIIYIFILKFLYKKLYQKIIKVIETDNKFMDTVIEYLNKIATIKILKSKYFFKNLDDNINNNLESKLSLDKNIYKIELVKNILEEIMLILILFLYYKLNKDYMMLIVFISVYNYFLQSINFFVSMIPNYLYFKDVYKRIKSIFDLELNNQRNNIGNKGEIIINKLSYSYNKFNNIFNNYNIEIKNGDKILLQGSNGSGKSTLLGVITGIYNDYNGKVEVSSKVSYLEQNSHIFNDTILNNIILDKKFDNFKFKTVEKITLLKDVIYNKPNGYNTNISSITNFSGGEKQKIMLARTLYNDFNILILDESLSEISKQTRKQILLNIINYYQNKTIIYVSHHNEDINFDRKIYLTARKDLNVNRKGNV